MEYRQLGRSGLKISLHTLGTMNFSSDGYFGKIGSASVKDAKRLVDVAVDHGVNMLDTSNAYTTGKSEEALGEILKGSSDQLMVGTKVRFSMGTGPNEQGLSRFHIIHEAEASLKRLKRDHIDLYFLHEWDGLTPVEEMMEALDTLVKQGKVRYVGCSNFSGWHLMKSLAMSDRLGLVRHVAHQAHYSLLGRDFEWELMPLALDQGVGTVVWSPLGWGRLSGKYRRSHPIDGTSRAVQTGNSAPPVADEKLYSVMDVLDEVAAETGKKVPQIALNWLLQRPAVSTVIVGARNPGQLRENLGAVGWKLDPGQMARLNAASQSPLPYPNWHQAGFNRNPPPV